MHNSSLGCWSLTSSLWDGKTAYNGGFFISAVPPMKTTLYIDGFNLYYGVLKGSPYKWLDVVKLFTHICQEQNPDAEIVAVKFFTAPVKGKIATRGEQAVMSQNAYHKALRTLYPDLFQVIEGYFILEAGGMGSSQQRYQKSHRI